MAAKPEKPEEKKTIKMPPRGHVRLRKTGAGGYLLTIPINVGRLIGEDRLFAVELVEEGILLRYVEGGSPIGETLPKWLLEGSGE